MSGVDVSSKHSRMCGRRKCGKGCVRGERLEIADGERHQTFGAPVV